MTALPQPSAVRASSDPVPPTLRIPFIQKAVLTHAGGREELFLVDLGLRGVFAERSAPLPVDEAVTLSFLLPGNAIPLSFQCRVAWWHPPGGPLVSKDLPAGVGLEFLESSEADRRRLGAYLDDYLRRRPLARRFHRPRPLGGEEP
jgi:hypothetical protein